eukprot:9511028-Alexandrium_andersonii.AAC.1
MGPHLAHQLQRLRIDTAAHGLLPDLDLFGPRPATAWTGPVRIVSMDLAREGRRPARLVAQDLTDPRIAAPAVAWRGATDWFTHMGPGDT